MISMNKYIQILIVTVFILSMCLLLSFYFEASNLSIAVMIGLGLLGGILSRFFIGYVTPSRLIYRSRFIVYGIGFGIMIGLLLFLTRSIKDQTFVWQDMLKWLLISVPIGIIVTGTMSYLRFRKLKDRTNSDIENKNTISDFAICTDSEYKTVRGRLLLTNSKLSFYSVTNGERVFEMALIDVNPVIKNSKFMSIPNGFSISNATIALNVAFPYYWIKLIKKEKTTTQQALKNNCRIVVN